MLKILRKIECHILSYNRRKKNIKHAYDYPDVQDGWEKQGNPVLDKKLGTVFNPWVRKEIDTYVMYVSERSIGAITRFTSQNGYEWKNRNVILKGIPGHWDEIVNRPCCIVVNGVWYLWYTGQKEGKSCIGLATSTDGVHFARAKKEPVLMPSGDIEKNAVMNPCVIYKNGIFKMWYATGENYEPDVLCLAESRDGIEWIKYKDNPILKPSKSEFECAKVGGCDVLEDQNKLGMYYIGYQNVDTGRICYAESYDGGYTWNSKGLNPLISPTKDGWDAHSIYKPTVVKDETSDSLYLWYNGRKNRNEYIGLAIKGKSKYNV